MLEMLILLILMLFVFCVVDVLFGYLLVMLVYVWMIMLNLVVGEMNDGFFFDICC